MIKRTKVLIVDDEEICRTITSEMVKKIGLSPLTACDGLEAIRIFKKHGHSICCILLDLNMPRMDGFETFRRIKEIDDTIRIYIASGYLDEKNIQVLKPLNPAGYLPKPIRFNDLQSILHQVRNLG